MGCDIHQINLIINKESNTVLADGEVPVGEEYSSDFVEELVDGRNYDLFGILAGVRGDQFTIRDNVYCGIPEEMPENIADALKEPDACLHSFTFFYMPDLLKQLEWTAEKIEMYIKARAMNDAEFIASGDIDEYCWLKKNVEHMAEKLKKAKAVFKDNGNEEDFKTSKVFFFFDS